MIFLADRVISVWESEVTRRFQPETGGLLLGYETASGQLVIAEATRPGPQARRGLFTFEPDHEWDRHLIAEAYTSSGRVVCYLGEWHSHSFGLLRPTRDDIQTMRLIASYEPSRLSNPISAIVTRRRHEGLRWVIYQLNAAGHLETVTAKITSDYHQP